MMAWPNSSPKFDNPQGVKPQANVAALLPVITRLVPHAMHGQHGMDVYCYGIEKTLAKQFVKVKGQVPYYFAQYTWTIGECASTTTRSVRT